MRLTETDKQYLLTKVYMGGKDAFTEDLPQIEAVAGVAKYELLKHDGSLLKPISRTAAIRLCGREGWLAGISRAAFHWTAMRETADGRMVWFNARSYFRGVA